MAQVTIHAAKSTLSQLLTRIETGEEILIARGKHPIAKLVPLQPAAPKRRFGVLNGTLRIGPEFFDPLPEHELWGWEE